MYKCCILSVGWFSWVWILSADVSEHSLNSLFWVIARRLIFVSTFRNTASSLFLMIPRHLFWILSTDVSEHSVRTLFWVIPQRLNFKCRRFGTLCQLLILGDSRLMNFVWTFRNTVSSLFLAIPRHAFWILIADVSEHSLSSLFWVIPQCMNFNMQTFRNTVSFIFIDGVSTPPIKMELTECVRNVGTQISDAGNHPKERMRIQKKKKFWNQEIYVLNKNMSASRMLY